MLVYMVYDKKTGEVVHIHSAVDIAGRSVTCSENEVLGVLPKHIDSQTVGIASTEMELVPSGRHTSFSVNTKTGTVVRTAVKDLSKIKKQAAKDLSRRKK